MDPETLRHITDELATLITGGIVSRVEEPDGKNIVLRIFSRGADKRLIISVHPRYTRMHLTKEAFVNPPTPLRFCAYLRSRIVDARILSIVQAEGERIIRISLKKGYDEGAEVFTLIAELTGKSSNIILVDKDGVILDALRYFPPETSVRAVFPGIRLHPLGTAPLQARPDEAVIEKWAYPTWNEAVDRHFSHLIRLEQFTLEKNRLRRLINEALKKVRRKLDNLIGDRAKADVSLDAGRIGELLKANYHLIRKGASEVEAMDYTVDPPKAVRVELDRLLSPQENCERYFKRARKGKKALELLRERVPAVEKEIEYIEGLIYELDVAGSWEELQAVKDELTEGGYMKKEGIGPGMVKEAIAEKKDPVRRYVSTEGFEVLCGKSGAGNDLLVKKYAAKEDIWFHVKGLPGSHVLIKVAGRGALLTKKTIEEAASLAAFHSKAREAGKVEVIYAQAMHVKKPKGAKPGLVTVSEYKSAYVRPVEMKPLSD